MDPRQLFINKILKSPQTVSYFITPFYHYYRIVKHENYTIIMGSCYHTLVSRAAIAGGIPAEEALSPSDNYIRYCETHEDPNLILNLQHNLVLDYASRVHDLTAGKKYDKYKSLHLRYQYISRLFFSGPFSKYFQKIYWHDTKKISR